MVLAALALTGAGCRENPVTAYSVPHEEHAAARTATAAVPRSTNAGAAKPAGAQLEWSKPAAWTEKPGGQMRLGSYTFTAPDGAQADISVTAFPDAAGGLLANINRWRGQVGLAPIDTADIEKSAERAQIAGQVAWLVDFSGTPAGGAPAMGSTPAPSGPTRLIGAIVPVSGTSWFFKMIGPEAVVASQREAFKEMVASIHAVAPHVHAAEAAPAPAMPSAGPVMAGGDVPPPPKAEGFTFEAPTGWEPQKPSSMRVASFLVPGPGVPAADVSVIVLSGSAGGDLANVNRWRDQLGLAAIGEPELAQSAIAVTGPAGTFQMFDLESSGAALEGGHRARMLAAILEQGEKTWFFKMTGEAGHVATQREAFTQFLRSFHAEAGK